MSSMLLIYCHVVMLMAELTFYCHPVAVSERTAEHLSENLRELRKARGLSQARASKLADIPRATWTNLESGSANPTLAVLTAVADALNVRLDELLASPRRPVQLYRATQLRSRSRGGVEVRKLLPEGLPGLETERMEFAPGATMRGTPHTPGTREYLTCERGVIELSVDGEAHRLDPGDVLVFRGDRPHGYRNPGRAGCVAYSVVAFAPVRA